jgi:geranylgeranyl diphosphate synthase type I
VSSSSLPSADPPSRRPVLGLRPVRGRLSLTPAPHEPDRSVASPLDVEQLRTRVQAVLDDVLAAQRAVLTEISTDLAPLVDVVVELLGSGKRLRAGFCYWGFRGARRAGVADELTDDGADDGAVRAAAALELFHAAALIHDDVMDDSDTRRGRATVHRRFERAHRDAGLRGAPDRHGAAAAVLAGDLCLSWADELLATCGLPPDAVARGRGVFDLMRTQVIGGQYLDLLEQAHTRTVQAAADGRLLGRAQTVLRYKSAKYTVEHPLLLGAALAGAPMPVRAAYSAFGLPLGEAFQLRDDLLGVFGDPARTGKPAGDDLREGKSTVLVAIAEQRATAQQRAVLAEQLGNPDLDADGEAAVHAVLRDTGAVAEVEQTIDALTDRACTALAAAAVSAQARQVLGDLATAATRRET